MKNSTKILLALLVGLTLGSMIMLLALQIDWSMTIYDNLYWMYHESGLTPDQQNWMLTWWNQYYSECVSQQLAEVCSLVK